MKNFKATKGREDLKRNKESIQRNKDKDPQNATSRKKAGVAILTLGKIDIK